jgi:hypothetical protein
MTETPTLVSHRNDIWTWLIIASVTLLIWYWAAGETRVTRTLHTRLEFVVAGAEPADWLIDPAAIPVDFEAEGTARAIRNAEEAVKGRRLSIALPAGAGIQRLDVTQLLRDHPDVQATGITIVSADPSTRELELDELVASPALVLPLPGVEADDVVVEPAQVTVRMPGAKRPLYGPDLTVEPVVPQRQLERLAPGTRHTLENIPVRLSEGLPAGLPADTAVEIDPPQVKISFTIRSRIRQVELDYPVRVLIAGPHEDHEYVELEPKQLRDVTVTVPDELARKIESGEAVVFAVLHLKSREREARITEKAVTYFMALRSDDTAEFVRATVAGSSEPPVISLTITDPPTQ